MIVGIGCDICRVDRVARLYATYGAKFADRLLTPQEQRPRMTAAFLAKRFAGKEAVVKAMGTAFTNGLFLKDVQIIPDASGKPLVTLSARAQAFVPTGAVVHLSLSDERDYALAYAVVEVR
jgi:holo-[acyl-carrier protein] synthase